MILILYVNDILLLGEDLSKIRLAAVQFPNLLNLVQTRFGTGVQGSGSAEYLNPNLLAGSGSSRGRTQTPTPMEKKKLMN